MATITFTISAADIARITEAAQAAGSKDAKAWVVSLIKDGVHRYERTRDVTAAQKTVRNYDTTYTSVTVT